MKSTASEVGVFEAKTNLSQLLPRVERGESLVITRHGVPVARIVPYEKLVDRARVEQAVHGLLEFGKGIKLPEGWTIKQLIAEGRR